MIAPPVAGLLAWRMILLSMLVITSCVATTPPQHQHAGTYRWGRLPRDLRGIHSEEWGVSADHGPRRDLHGYLRDHRQRHAGGHVVWA
jgi:hypothetical protein